MSRSGTLAVKALGRESGHGRVLNSQIISAGLIRAASNAHLIVCLEEFPFWLGYMALCAHPQAAIASELIAAVLFQEVDYELFLFAEGKSAKITLAPLAVVVTLSHLRRRLFAFFVSLKRPGFGCNLWRTSVSTTA